MSEIEQAPVWVLDALKTTRDEAVQKHFAAWRVARNRGDLFAQHIHLIALATAVDDLLGSVDALLAVLPNCN